MLVLVFRSIVLFLFVIVVLRLMGKRQIGELQPAELVVTILISQLASMPMQDINAPIMMAIVPMATIVILEIFLSIITLKSNKMRNILEGSPVIVIANGKPIISSMKKLRFTIHDLTEQLRLNGIFSIDDVKYAIVETNGELSVMPKSRKSPPTADDLNIDVEDEELPFLVICDGKIQHDSLRRVGLTVKDLNDEVRSQGLSIDDVFLMSADIDRHFVIIENDSESGGLD